MTIYVDDYQQKIIFQINSLIKEDQISKLFPILELIQATNTAKDFIDPIEKIILAFIVNSKDYKFVFQAIELKENICNKYEDLNQIKP